MSMCSVSLTCRRSIAPQRFFINQSSSSVHQTSNQNGHKDDSNREELQDIDRFPQNRPLIMQNLIR